MKYIDLDLNPYKEENLYYAKGYDGFISQEGIFYKTGKRNTHSSVHDYYAEELVNYLFKENIYDIYEKFKLRNKEYANLILGAKDILIHFYGFINYQKFYDKLEINAPNKFFNSYSVTDKQILLLEKLLILNNDNYEAIYQIFDNNFGNQELYLNKYRKLQKPD